MLFNRTKGRQSEVRSTTFTEIFLVFLVILFLFVIKKDIEIADLKNNNVINLQKEIEKLKTEISNLKDKIKVLKNKNNELIAEVERLKIYAGALPVPGEVLPPTRTELKKEIMKLKNEIAARDKYIDQLLEIKKKYDLLTSKGSNLSDIIAKLQIENDSLKSENNELKNKMKDLKLQNNIYRDEINIIKKGLGLPACQVKGTKGYKGDKNEYLFHIEIYEDKYRLTKKWKAFDETLLKGVPGISGIMETLPFLTEKEFKIHIKKIYSWSEKQVDKCRFYVQWNYHSSVRKMSIQKMNSARRLIERYFYHYELRSIGKEVE